MSVASLFAAQKLVSIGMTLKQDGAFVVSIFDPNDPEHVQKRKRLQRAKQQHDTEAEDASARHRHVIDYKEDAPESFPVEQIILFVACLFLFALYVAAKVAFHEDVRVQHEQSEL